LVEKCKIVLAANELVGDGGIDLNLRQLSFVPFFPIGIAEI
jgi:hypothetical protein